MKILHIASIVNNPCCGTSVVIPQHIVSQQMLENVAFINFRNGEFKGIDNQFLCKSLFDFYKYFKQFGKPDLVVFHEVYIWQYPIIAYWLRKQKIPYIIIPHCCLTDGAINRKKLKKRIGNLLLFNSFINGAAAIQCLSKNESETTHFGKRKFIGTNGIDFPNVYKKEFNSKKINIVFIGRFDIYHKGLDLLVKAFSLNTERLRKCEVALNIYGPILNSDSELIKKMINENKLSDLVHLNDAVTGDEKVKILLDSDVFIQTSRFEGMPMGILEALSYGLPCLVTKGTTLGEIIEKYDAGWVCETNAENVAECIERCIDEKDLFKVKGQNARKLIEENFTWDKVANDTIKIYQQLIGINNKRI